jgi:hypothetical protein
VTLLVGKLEVDLMLLEPLLALGLLFDVIFSFSAFMASATAEVICGVLESSGKRIPDTFATLKPALFLTLLRSVRPICVAYLLQPGMMGISSTNSLSTARLSVLKVERYG